MVVECWAHEWKRGMLYLGHRRRAKDLEGTRHLALRARWNTGQEPTGRTPAGISGDIRLGSGWDQVLAVGRSPRGNPWVPRVRVAEEHLVGTKGALGGQSVEAAVAAPRVQPRVKWTPA